MMRFTCRLIIGLTLAISASTALEAAASLIIDDFVDGAEASSPEMQRVFVETAQIGELNATRSIRVWSARTQSPIVGTIDSNLKAASRLTIDFQEATERPGASFQFDYEFPEMDLTHAGKYNALLFDFEAFIAVDANPSLRVLFATRSPQGFGDTLVAALDIPNSAEPFTLEIPFGELAGRGSGGPFIPLGPVWKISSEVIDLDTVASSQWQGQLSRIRLGTIPVPEPTHGVALLLLASSMVGRRSLRCAATHGSARGRHRDLRPASAGPL